MLVHDVFDLPQLGVVHHQVHPAGIVPEEPGPRAPASDVCADDHRPAPAVEHAQESVVVFEFEFIFPLHAAADGHPVDDRLAERIVVGVEFHRGPKPAVSQDAAVIEPYGPRGAGCEGYEIDDYQREEGIRAPYPGHPHQEDEEVVSETAAARASAPLLAVISHSSG